MKTWIIALLFIPLAAIADARLELHTNTIHAPYDQNDADNELELTDGGSSIVATALPDGTYNAYYETTIRNIPIGIVRGVSRIKLQNAGSETITTSCGITQGVYEDKDENVYVTNLCLVRLTYYRTRNRKYDLDVEVYLRKLTAATEAEATAADYAGAAPQMR